MLQLCSVISKTMKLVTAFVSQDFVLALFLLLFFGSGLLDYKVDGEGICNSLAGGVKWGMIHM